MRKGAWLLLGVLFLARGPACQAASAKRGICAKDLSAEDFKALSPGVSWWTNWHFEPDGSPLPEGPEFLPMLWSGHPDLWKGLEGRLKGGPRPRAILAINEPNLKNQAGMTPQATAEAFLRLRKLASRHGVPLVGPQMALGSAADNSVKDWDPVQKKEVLYTYMIPFLDAFRLHLGSEPMPDLGVHCYGNAGELKWAVGELASRYGVKIWVTEFNEWKASDPASRMAYLIEAVKFLEESPHVAGYAWFMSRMGDDNPQGLLEKEPGKLSDLGQAYVGAPAGKAAPGPIRP